MKELNSFCVNEDPIYSESFVFMSCQFLGAIGTLICCCAAAV